MNKRSLLAGASVALLSGSFATAAFAQSPDAGAVDLPHPAHIHDGVCPTPGDVAQPLSDLVIGTDAAVGVATGVPVEVSNSIVPMSLEDILGADRSINVHESADAMDVYIACGDLGGQMLGDNAIAIGISEQNGSGHHGVAWLQDNGDGSTNVQVFLMSTRLEEGAGPDASGAPVESMAPAPSMTPAESMAPMGSMAPAPSADASTDPAMTLEPTIDPAESMVPAASPAA